MADVGNPWLSVALADYEAHMNSPEVQQLGALAELFADALALQNPKSVAILGIAGGNGLEAIDGKITKRVVGLDINPAYLGEVRRRYGHVAGLELHCVDLTESLAEVAPVELVHAALVFEHGGVGMCLENALSLVAAGGALSVVLQLPSETEGAVTASEFASMQNLRAHFTMIEPRELRERVEKRGLQLIHETRRMLPRGKALWAGIFGIAQKRRVHTESTEAEHGGHREQKPNPSKEKSAKMSTCSRKAEGKPREGHHPVALSGPRRLVNLKAIEL